MCAVIDPEVALKACQEVLLKVRLQNKDATQQQQQLDNSGQAEDDDEDDEDPGDGGGRQWQMSADSNSIKEEDEEEEEQKKAPPPMAPSPPSSSKQSWLLRLFESKLFDVSMAISYLYKSKEPGVQAYIGNRLFSFPDQEVDFYLPQLLSMYVHMDTEVGDAIRPYLVSDTRANAFTSNADLFSTDIYVNVTSIKYRYFFVLSSLVPPPSCQIYRCRGSITFSLLSAWLLGAYSSDMHISTQRHSRGTKFRKLILSDELKPDLSRVPSVSRSPASLLSHHHQRNNSNHAEAGPAPYSAIPDDPSTGEIEVLASPSRRTHQRSKSDAAAASCGTGAGLRRTGSNPKVEAVPEEVRGAWPVMSERRGGV